MNQWSRRRKRTILTLIVFVLVFLIGLPLFFLFYRAPTCTDGEKNADETGVDCGGSCERLCTTESLPLILKGDPRVLKVRDNDYEVVALVENPNANGEVRRAKYIFKLYDAASLIPIKVVEGETYVPKGSVFALFEGPFTLGEGLVPVRATLEWEQKNFLWYKNNLEIPKLAVENLVLSEGDTRPRLSATVENLSLEEVSNIDLVAVVYDENGNIFASSKTFIDVLPVGGKSPIIYTWPEPFQGTSSLATDIYIRIFPE